MEDLEGTVTISLERYKELEQREEQLKQKFNETFIQVFHQYMLFYNTLTEDEGIKEVVRKAKEIDDENKKLNGLVDALQSSNYLLKNAINLKTKKSWWK